MSRVIVDDHLFTPDEVAYLQARNRYREIEINARDFGVGGAREHEKPQFDDDDDDDIVLELDKDIYEYVVGLDVKQVKAALRKLKINPVGSEHELKAVLAQHLQGTRDANRSSS